VGVTLLTWGYASAVGVRAMDDQHEILMDTLNELRMTTVTGCGREQTGEVLDRLIEYSRMHFASEEELMQQTGFPALNAHRTEHHRLMGEMLRAVHRLRHGEKLAIQPLFCRLRDSYIAHIEGPDREYGPWLNERGLF
jgi:hemerythrin